ncbi:MAG: hypothetical protein PHW04_11655, partial [Candidatus Wallbacteria bacterium]|nr:hypothetical protein [Candidatus Wallbacteria bacterium]
MAYLKAGELLDANPGSIWGKLHPVEHWGESGLVESKSIAPILADENSRFIISPPQDLAASEKNNDEYTGVYTPGEPITFKVEATDLNSGVHSVSFSIKEISENRVIQNKVVFSEPFEYTRTFYSTEKMLITAWIYDNAGNRAEESMYLVPDLRKLSVGFKPDELQDGTAPDGRWKYRNIPDDPNTPPGTWSSDLSAGVAELVPGKYELQAKNLSSSGWDFDNPPGGNKVVELTSDTDFTFIYKPAYKKLTFNINPDTPEVRDNARWSVYLKGSYKHGDSVSLQANESYYISFSDVTGWIRPSDQIVNLTANQTLTALYWKDPDYKPPVDLPPTTLKVTILPDQISMMTGWKSSADTTDGWHSSGDSVTVSPPRTISVYFKPVEYWNAPQTMNLDMKISREITVSYTPFRNTLSALILPPYFSDWIVKHGGKWCVTTANYNSGWIDFDQLVSLNAGEEYSVTFNDVEKLMKPQGVSGVMQAYPTYAYAPYTPDLCWQHTQTFNGFVTVAGKYLVADSGNFEITENGLSPHNDPLPEIYTKSTGLLTGWLGHECGRRENKAYLWIPDKIKAHREGSGMVYSIPFTTDCETIGLEDFYLPWASSIDSFSIGENYACFNIGSVDWYIEPFWGKVTNDCLTDPNALLGASGLNTALIFNGEFNLVGNRFFYHGIPGDAESPPTRVASGNVELVQTPFPYDSVSIFESAGKVLALKTNWSMRTTDLYTLGPGSPSFSVGGGDNFSAAHGKWRLYHEGCWRNPGSYPIPYGCNFDLEYKVDPGYDVSGPLSFYTDGIHSSVVVSAKQQRLLLININPSTAKFRFSSDPPYTWRDSGSYPLPGDSSPATQYVTLYFQDMSGWETPSPYSFIPFGTNEININIAYKPKRTLTVKLHPDDAILYGAKWRVSGYTGWMSSGDTVDLKDGLNVYVEYYVLSSSNGWINPTPLSEKLLMTENKVIDRSYSIVKRKLEVILGPDDYATSQGRWRIKGDQDWQQSGATCELRMNSLNWIEFLEITGRTTPSTIPCLMDKDRTLSAYYTGYHKLQVALLPQDAVAAGAKWRFADGFWHGTSETFDLVEGETYEIKFCPASGDFATPDPVIGTMEAQDQTVTAEYTHTGSYGYQVMIEATPEDAVLSGAGWRLAQEEDWHFSGTGVRLPAGGTYEILFRPVFGYHAPASVFGTIESSDLSIRPEYTPAYGILSVNTAPDIVNSAEAAWRLSGEVAWRQSESTVEMRIGTDYIIDFKPVEGWTSPKPITNMFWSENAVEYGNYSLIGSTLCVRIVPERIRAYTSWRLSGGQTWLYSGSTVIVPTGGTYELEFSDYQGYDKPTGITGRKSSWSETLTAEYQPEHGSWTLAADTVEFPQRSDFVALPYSAEILVISGRQGTQELSDIWSSTDGIAWTCDTESAAFGGRSLHACAEHNGILWLVGGWNGSVELGDIWTSTDGADWTLVTGQAAFGTRRNTHLVEHDGALWCFGGRRDSLELSDVWRSDNGGDWTLVTAETGVSFASSTSIISYRGGFYLISSGQTGCWSSPDGEHWSQTSISEGFGDRYGAAAVAYNNLIWLAGGLKYESSGSMISDDAWHSADCSTWVEDTDKAGFGLRYGHALVSFQDKIWLLGGSDYTGTKNDLWYFEATKEVLTVGLHPANAITAGASWRVDGGEWITDGGTLEVPASKLFTLECKVTPSWTAPTQQSLVMPSANLTIDATYESSLRPLTVLISPEQAVTDGMKWKLSGETDWQNSGSFTMLDKGSPCTVECNGQISGWNTPEPVSLVVEESGSTVSVTCTPFYRNLTVNIGPEEAIQNGAAWRSSGTQDWKSSGFSIEVQAGKPYNLEFSAASRYLTPSDLSSLMPDYDNTISVNYPEQTCSLTVTLAPLKALQLGAGWKLAEENEWRNSGTSVAIQIGDTYSVEFSDLLDLIKPVSMSGMITSSVIIEPIYTENFWDVASAMAEFQPRYGAAAVVLSSEILLTGGNNGISTNKDVWRSQTGATWEILTAEAAFGNRFLHSMLEKSGEVWLLCGTSGSSIYGDIWHSSDGTDWQCAASSAAFGPRYGQAAAVFSGKLWVISGQGITGLKSDVWYSENGTDWSLAGDAPGFSARYGAAATVYDGKLWLIGGHDGTQPLSDVWSTDDGINWTMISASAIPARYYHQAIGYGGSLWMVGGFLANNNTGLESDFYSTTNGVDWTVHHDNEGFAARALPCLFEKSARLWLCSGAGPAGPVADALYSADTIGYQCLTVEITPQAALDAGAGWKLASDSVWRQSGTSARVPENSSYEITFRILPHWATPEPVSGNIGTAEASFSRSYIQSMRDLTVFIEPTAALNDGAVWKFAGESEGRASGSSVTLPEGSRCTIETTDLNGWVTPQDKVIDLEQDTSETFTYQVQKYHLSVSLSPNAAVSEGAGWRYSGESNWRQAGTVEIERGTAFGIEYREIPGWFAPSSTGETVGYEDIQINQEYKLRNYPVCITIEPFWACEAGALWRMAGESGWHASSDAVNLPHDTNYTIEFSTVEGWVKPDAFNGNIGTADLNLSSQYKPVKYRLSVQIGPDLAVSETAGWRLVGEERWRGSGDSLEIENHSHYQVEFKDLQGWANHGWQVGDVVNGNVSLSEEYDPVEYELSMAIEPENARNAGAKWRMLPDGDWLDSQVSLTVTHGTQFSVEFTSLSGWISPQAIEGIMPAENTVKDIEYSSIMHKLSAVILPAEAAGSGAAWALASDMIQKNSGDSVEIQECDNYQVVFNDIYGWTTPSSVTGEVGTSDLTISVEYLPINQKLSVLIQPQSAADNGGTWKINGSDVWNLNGDSVEIRRGVTYEILFSDATGFSTPMPISGLIGEDDFEQTAFYTELMHTCCVVLGPEEALARGGQWMLAGEQSWHQSGEQVVLQEGLSYPVWLKPVPGWCGPSDAVIETVTDGTIELSYVPRYQKIGIQFPPETMAAGAAWKLAGETDWRQSGDSVELQSGTSFEVTFKDVEKMNKPENILRVVGASDEVFFVNYTWKYWFQASDGGYPARYDQATVYFKDKLYLLGGYDSQKTYADVWVTVDGINWERITENAGFAPRYGFGCGVIGDKIYVFGGADQNNIFSDVWSSEDGVEWTQVTMNASFGHRYVCGTAVYGGKLWMAGGFDGTAFKNDVWSTTDGLDWTQAVDPAPFTPRAGLALTATPTGLILTGGYDGVNLFSDVWYTPDGSTWSNLAQTTDFGPRAFHSCVFYNGMLWIAGGFVSPTRDQLDPDFYFSDNCINWTRVMDNGAVSARALQSAAMFHDTVWLFGGISKNGLLSDAWYAVKPCSLKTLKVNLHPEIVSADAGWKMAGNEHWKTSGSSIFVLAGDTYELIFKDVAGWVTPSPVSGVIDTEETDLDVTYQSSETRYTLSVGLYPAGAVDSGAKWKLYGESVWRDSQSSMELSEHQIYRLQFSNAAGFRAPSMITGTMNGNTLISANYCQARRIGVSILPNDAVMRGAQWKLSGDNSWNYPSNAAYLYEGDNYSINLKILDNYYQPDTLSGTMPQNDLTLEVTYTWKNWTKLNQAGIDPVRFGSAMAVFNGKCWLTGGSDGTNELNDVWSSDNGSTWEKSLETIPGPCRYGHTITSWNNGLWLIGGKSGQNYLSDVLSSSDGQTWTTEVSSTPFGPRFGHSCFTLGGKLWIIGGRDGTTLHGDIWSSANGTEWTLEAQTAPFGARYGQCVIADADGAYLIGGNDGVNLLDDVWHTIDGINWELLTQTAGFGRRMFLSGVKVGNTFIIAGGTLDMAMTSYDLNYYKSTDGIVWQQVTDKSGCCERTMAGAVAFNGTMLLTAGMGPHSAFGDTWAESSRRIYHGVSVTLQPEAEISAIAGWRFVGTQDWSDSCTRFIEEGTTFEIEFKQIQGWLTPDNVTGIIGTQEIVIDQEYLPAQHNLTVNISPAAVNSAGAAWKLLGEADWRSSGSYIELQEGTSYEIIFRDIIGYEPPANITGTVSTNDKSETGTYSAPAWSRQTASAAFGGRYGHGSAVLNGKLFVIGGYDGTYRRDIWSTVDGITWTKECDAPFAARYSFGCTVHDGKIWIAGGGASTGIKSDVWQSSDGKNWTQVTADGGFGARNAAGLESFEGKLWLIGGNIAGGSKNDVWSSYNGITWTKECDAPFTSRYCLGTAVYVNKIWVVGGYTTTNNTYLRDVWNSADGKNWTQVTNQGPFSARFGTCAAYDGRLWLSCGKTTGGGTVADVWYTKDGVSWTQAVSTGLTSRYCHSMTAFNGSLWIIAGSTGSAPYLNDTWNYYEAPVYGQLSVQLSPAEAVTTGAGWKLVGETGWRDSGTNAQVQEGDGYMLEFRQTGGYCTPGMLKGVMPIDGTTENVMYAEYNQNLSHNLTVTISPPGAVFSGAGWRLSGENLWRNSGTSVSLSEGSTCTVEYRDVIGYSQPESVHGTMEAGDISVPCIYQAVPWTQGQTAGFGGRYGHGNIVLNGKMFVIGGYDGTYRHDVWSTIDGLTWTKECDAPFSSRYLFGCTVHDGKIWIAGGNASTVLKSDVWQSVDGKNWTQVTADGGFTARSAASLLSFDCKLWLIGGCITGGAGRNDVWSSVDGITWTKECDAPFTSRFCHGTEVYANKIWVIGGYTTTNNTYLKDVWNSSDGKNWTQVSSQNPFSVRYGTCAAYNGRLWLSCGKTTGDVTVADIWYTKDGVNWTQASSAGLSPRYCHSMTAFNGSLWIIAGSTGTTPYLNDTWSYYEAPVYGQLTVQLNPADAVASGAGWRLT